MTYRKVDAGEELYFRQLCGRRTETANLATVKREQASEQLWDRVGNVLRK